MVNLREGGRAMMLIDYVMVGGIFAALILMLVLDRFL